MPPDGQLVNLASAHVYHPSNGGATQTFAQVSDAGARHVRGGEDDVMVKVNVYFACDNPIL